MSMSVVPARTVQFAVDGEVANVEAAVAGAEDEEEEEEEEEEDGDGASQSTGPSTVAGDSVLTDADSDDEAMAAGGAPSKKQRPGMNCTHQETPSRYQRTRSRM